MTAIWADSGLPGRSENLGVSRISEELIKTHSRTGQVFEAVINDIPDECPICHMKGNPSFRVSTISGDYPGNLLQTAFQCTNKKCEHLFIGDYRVTSKFEDGPFGYTLISVSPIVPKEIDFGDYISTISADFIDIYNQSVAAEALGLTQLVGIGLRKALEFLIKDYLIVIKSDEKEEIIKAFLGQCIEKYLDDPLAKQCASRAVWLGNDETHYKRKWVNFDIENLKELVMLTVQWIERSELTKKYAREMTNGK